MKYTAGKDEHCEDCGEVECKCDSVEDLLRVCAAETGISLLFEAAKEIEALRAKIERLERERDRRGNQLEDVVNELDLSDGAIEKHGPLGTTPAELVRLVLEEKDLMLAILKANVKAAEARAEALQKEVEEARAEVIKAIENAPAPSNAKTYSKWKRFLLSHVRSACPEAFDN